MNIAECILVGSIYECEYERVRELVVRRQANDDDDDIEYILSKAMFGMRCVEIVWHVLCIAIRNS